MLVEERRQKVLELVKDRGFVALADLALELHASESTLRRDLEFWDQQGLLKRTHGGARMASALPAIDTMPAMEDRASTAVAEKRLIAQAAARRIADGSSILVDAGTTTLELAKLLIGRPLQVVTNSLPIATLLSQTKEPDVILLGGFVYPRTGVALGPLTMEQLKNIHVAQAILSCHGITEKGLYNHNMLLVETQRSMLRSADEAMILADSSKIGRQALTQLCPLSDIDTLVVDAGIPPDVRQRVEEQGVQVILASNSREIAG
ncbi:MAG TPA: DeoR/GlpR family DNA-binding transcription regulator [Gemmatales bacterium]|nr:DeoR/GlpR family DNA-binding transcription regulator [Gemmatales bacterium]HMP16848.1 DeoR/GlpR family DNA-binding transcription regulator [Gemmatales bacterium]